MGRWKVSIWVGQGWVERRKDRRITGEGLRGQRPQTFKEW